MLDERLLRPDGDDPEANVGGGGGSRILVVDDDPRNLRLYAGILTATGYDVTTVPSGEEALEVVDELSPELILLDVMMPGLDGFETCQALKQNPRTVLIPVVLLTALNSTEDKIRGLEVGADDFVSKPANRQELLARVRSLLRIRLLQRRLLESMAEVDSKNRQLIDLQEMKDLLFQTIVHDLKSPLAGIMANLEFALQSRPQPSATQLLEYIRRSHEGTSQMHKMILNLLDVSRMEERRIDLDRRPVDLCALTAETLDALSCVLQRRELQVIRELDRDTPVIEADPDYLRRVLENLLSNAVDHTEPGGFLLVGAAPDEGGGVRVWVQDSGEGIPPEHLESIFEKFVRVEGSRQQYGNRGLGLTYCKLAVETHGGRIWAESEVGEWSRFTFVVPPNAPEEASPGAPESVDAVASS